MDFTGEYRIPAPRAQVWQALNDPEILKACIDGCEELTWAGEGVLDATVRAKVGPVHARFKGTVSLTDVQPGESYVLVGEGKGGAAGFAKGQAAVHLTDDDEGTVLRYQAAASVGGKIATVGSRLITGVANKYADDFFQSFTNRLMVALKVAELSAFQAAADAGRHEELDLGPAEADLMTPTSAEEDAEAEALLRAMQTADAAAPIQPRPTVAGSPAEEPGRFLPLTAGTVIIPLGWGFMLIVLVLLFLV
ncbi:CoxG family protein [Novispirillum sp. DQ9]|uniref:CoxG family protein n=1 Tax=Novispirillum sp. DQ9 TaxID=3398612 RepID=UPI003C7D5953